MKKLLTLSFLIISLATFAQRDTMPSQALPYRFGNFYNFSPGSLRVDSIFFFGVRDTNITPIRKGAVIFWENPGVDSTLWLWDAVRWKKFGEGGGGSIDTTNLSYRIDTVSNYFSGGYNSMTQLTDTSYTINRFDGTKDTVEFVADTTCESGGGGLNTVTLNAGDNIEITGDATQSIINNPTWTISAIATQWRAPFASTFGASGGITASSTYYNQVSGRATGFITDESTVQSVVSEDGDINNLFVRTTGTQPASGSIVVTLRVNGSSSALTVTIPANSSTHTFSDITHTVSVVAGDLVDWQVVNNASATGQTIISIGASQTGTFAAP